MEKKRQPHADLIIMQANDVSLRFDVQCPVLEHWDLVTTVPCKFNPDNKYRLHEREFPKTSLSDDQLSACVHTVTDKWEDELRKVANAAIKQYILDTEKESK